MIDSNYKIWGIVQQHSLVLLLNKETNEYNNGDCFVSKEMINIQSRTDKKLLEKKSIN